MNEQQIVYRFTLEKGTDTTLGLEENLNALGAVAPLSERERFQLQLALDELVTNTVSYGFASDHGTAIEIEIVWTPGQRYEITYADDAPQFDPVHYSGDGKQSGTEATGFGGFGISLVKKIMDSVTYRYTGKQNIIQLTKSLEDSPE